MRIDKEMKPIRLGLDSQKQDIGVAQDKDNWVKKRNKMRYPSSQAKHLYVQLNLSCKKKLLHEASFLHSFSFLFLSTYFLLRCFRMTIKQTRTHYFTNYFSFIFLRIIHRFHEVIYNKTFCFCLSSHVWRQYEGRKEWILKL